MAKKRRAEEAKVDTSKSKELKIITVQVVTKDKVISDERKMGLLYVIYRLGPLHEKTLQTIVKEIADKGYSLGYRFANIAGSFFSPELKSDLVALMYVGFVENEPGPYRRLRVTSEGKEAIEKRGAPRGLVELINKHYEELKRKVSVLNSEVDVELRRKLKEMSMPRRRPSPLGI